MSIPSGFGQYSHLSSRSTSINTSSSPQLERSNQTHTPTPAYSPPPLNFRNPFDKSTGKGGVRWGSDQFYSQQQLDSSTVKDEEDDQDEEEEDELVDEENREFEEGWRGQGRGKTLSITATRGRVGCCYYDGDAGKIYFLSDQQDTNQWDLVTMIIEQINPLIVLTPANADPNFIETLQQVLSTTTSSTSNSNSNSEDDSTSCQLEFRPPREFYAGQGKQALSSMIITEGGIYDDGEPNDENNPGESKEYQRNREDNENEERNAYDYGKSKYRRRNDNFEMQQGDRGRRNRELRLEGFLNGLDASPLTLGCAAALLGHISRTISASGELNHDGRIEVSGLESMNLHEVMCISQDALLSLQIFSSESHATSHSDFKKEGFSLFGILNKAKTPLGRSLMSTWFLRPSLNLDLIQSRHNAIECFLRTENQAAVETILAHFTSIKNIGRTLRLLGNGRGGLRDWKAVWSFIFGAVMVRDAVLTLFGRYGIDGIDKVIESFDPQDLKELGGMINDVIDWEESALLPGRIIVKSRTNRELDELRRNYAGLSDLLSQVARDISCETTREFAETLSVVYFPQLGYLIAVPYVEGVLDPSRFPQDDWQFQFVTESSAYFKSDKCRDLDSHIGDLHSFVADKEIEIVHALLTELMKREQAIMSASTALAELDCLIALAEAARIYEWSRPNMTEENVTRIRKFRHPLVELCVDSFVQNDVSLVGSRGVNWNTNGEEVEIPLEGTLDPELSMLVVTGANYSGKSVYLKTIALLTFMAQIGSFIPAEKALIGITDRILTRISTRESISRGSSAFMIDLQQISFILRNATPRSLIIIDEFGKGTESDDGAGLLCGVLEHLVNRGDQAPRVAVSTHFQNVFANGLLNPTLPIGLAHMEILLNEAKSVPVNRTTDDSNSSSRPISDASTEVTYLYRLSPGLSDSSNAAACASLFGIDAKTVARATEISDLLSRFEISTLLNADLDEKEKKELHDSEVIARRFIAIDWTGEEGGMLDLDLEDLKRVLLDVVLIDPE